MALVVNAPFFFPGLYYQNLITDFISGGKVATGKAESLAFKTIPP